MEKLIERFVCTNTRCYSCGSLVYAVEKVKTANHIYHKRCFCCRICKRNLNGSTLNEEGDDIYCTNCYRKKQNGDCNGLDFQRAAKERAQFVYNRQHPDQPSPKINPRPPIQRSLSRNQSWTLRQLERRFLSYQEPHTKDFQKSSENYRRVTSAPHSFTLKTSFSSPINLTSFRRHSSATKSEPSPSLVFFPAYSPLTNSRTASTVTTPRTPVYFNGVKIRDGRNRSLENTQSRSNRSSLNLSPSKTPSLERKPSPRMGINQIDGSQDKRPTTFIFPDTSIPANRRRNNSINYSISPRKIK